ncbi:MAG: transcriptional regulator NrdR [Oscillospiraceae bacterium]|nr:transcriptional regulator NrdR [Oscillospiraceae bacterium]
MKCPYCAYTESKVVDSRPADEFATVRRRRQCLSCLKRFTTYETVERMPIVVIKKDGSRQSFDRSKILNGMIRACEKRRVTFETLNHIADEVEQAIYNQMQPEIPSTVIGEMVMERLRSVDEVAYVRFASVYRQFKDISTFMDELNRLIHEQ